MKKPAAHAETATEQDATPAALAADSVAPTRGQALEATVPEQPAAHTESGVVTEDGAAQGIAAATETVVSALTLPDPRAAEPSRPEVPTPAITTPAITKLEPDETTNDAANDSAPQAARPAAPPHTAPRAPGGVPGRVMPPPRAMAKAEQFAEGDHVVYPTHGVGKVERIAVEEIAGHKLELIHITFEENRMTLRVPVAKARSAGLRKLASRKVFDDALAVLKGRARIKRTMWSRRAQEYEAKINSGDPLAIAEVVRDLHRNAGQPDQSFSERQIYEAAMDRLAAELGALERIDKAAASVKLVEFLKTV